MRSFLSCSQKGGKKKDKINKDQKRFSQYKNGSKAVAKQGVRLAEGYKI